MKCKELFHFTSKPIHSPRFLQSGVGGVGGGFQLAEQSLMIRRSEGSESLPSLGSWKGFRSLGRVSEKFLSRQCYSTLYVPSPYQRIIRHPLGAGFPESTGFKLRPVLLINRRGLSGVEDDGRKVPSGCDLALLRTTCRYVQTTRQHVFCEPSSKTTPHGPYFKRYLTRIPNLIGTL